MDKPDLDYIERLSPAISIEQKITHRNPRSTMGKLMRGEVFRFPPQHG
jgi:excinuclease UvrABC ATPase subunit